MRITLAHGSGGKEMQELVRKIVEDATIHSDDVIG